MRSDRGHLTWIIASFVLFICGCSEFPCVTESTTHTLDPIAVQDEVRYTYWREDGSQAVVHSPEQVPGPAQHAVLVDVANETTPELHGTFAWLTDLTTESSQAHLRPMAFARTRALAGWSGAWAADWLEVRAGATAARIHERAELEARMKELEAPTAETDPPADEPVELPTADDEEPLEDLRAELADKGIVLDQVTRERAIRTVAARQPLPRDFALSVALRPAWLFVEEGCMACEHAMEQVGDDAHVLRISDPSNARRLRTLSEVAGIEPAVPLFWSGHTVLRGYDDSQADKLQEIR